MRNSVKPRRVLLQWPKLGPYHWVRVQAAAHALQHEGVQVLVLETAGREARYGWWGAEPPPRAVEHVQAFPGAVFEELRPWRVHRRLQRLLERLRPDLVVVNGYSLPDARALLYWGLRNGRPVVLMSDSKRDDLPRSRLREALKAHLIRSADAALVAGTPHAAYLKSLGFPESRIRFGLNVVDNAAFAQLAQSLRSSPERRPKLPGLEDRRPFFLAVGRLLRRKGYPELLEAYARYRERALQPWRLVLLGDGPMRAELEARARPMGADVVLAGLRTGGELVAYYAYAGAFVHPALQEQWGLVVNEAMASGLPVLVSRQSGCAQDLVREGENGATFDAHDPEELARRLQWISAPDTDRAALGRCSEAIIAQWGPERFAQGLQEAIEAALEKRDRPFSALACPLLWALQHVALRANSFHGMREL
ncbi:MAG: glycosyltransferase family 4 protein [Rhodothermia bacterium]|nr:glycosyltransferase family 4 protein [Rhodothermia bacterium]